MSAVGRRAFTPPPPSPQTFIFRCLDTIAAHDANKNTSDNSLKYEGDDGLIHQLLDDHANYYVQRDGCQVCLITLSCSHVPERADDSSLDGRTVN